MFFDKDAAVQGIPFPGDDKDAEKRLAPVFEFLFDGFLVVEVNAGEERGNEQQDDHADIDGKSFPGGLVF